MHNLRYCALVSIATLVCLHRPAVAETIVKTFNSGGGFGTSSPTTGLRVVLGYGGGSPLATTRIFDSILLPPSTSSQVLEIASNVDDPQFSNYITMITNGIDDNFGTAFWNDSNFGGYTWNPESVRLSLTPDLTGETIDLIRLTVDPFKITFAGGFYNVTNLTGGAVPIRVDYITVPEPGSALLMFAAAAICIRGRRKKGGTA